MRKIAKKIVGKLPYNVFFDRIYSFVLFFVAHRRFPRRGSGLFNDYLFFLKTSNEIEAVLRQFTSDKIHVKEFIGYHAPGAIVPRTLAIYDSVDSIGQPLPGPCVLKPAHGSGCVVFAPTGETILEEKDREALRKALSISPYTTNRERNYKNLKRRLICEEMLPTGKETKDYKIFCFRGHPRLIQVDIDRHTKHKRNIYDINWNSIAVEYNFPNGDEQPAPEKLKEMLLLAKVLSNQFEFVRIDFFVIDEKVYLGEITHCPESAHGRFRTLSEEILFSDMLFKSGSLF